jgi:putative ATPase
VPLHLRNAPTKLMRELGYGREYQYPHAAEDAFVATRNVPDELGEARFYEPTERGAEAAIAERLRAWRRAREPK